MGAEDGIDRYATRLWELPTVIWMAIMPTQEGWELRIVDERHAELQVYPADSIYDAVRDAWKELGE